MRALAVGWLCGTAWLQTRPDLPDSAALAAFGLAGVVCLIALTLIDFHHRPRRVALLIVAGWAFGAGWSGWRATERLADELPASLEGRDIVLTGVVAGLPDVLAQGRRFTFDIERANVAGEAVAVPRRVGLGWYGGARAVPELRPGERWTLTVRLKRPHGLANPGGFDAEAWWLSEGVRATGYVREADARRLDTFVFSLRDAVGRARAAIRDRVIAALPEARHAGVIVALVIGDQRSITADERDVFNRTGIGHLVAISGLHITMIAALVASILHTLWRHSFFTTASLPLRLPARKVAAAGGLAAALAYVALAGFGIPAQRTLLMLAVVTVAVWRDRFVAAPQVLAAALLVVLVFDPWAVLWPGFWLSFFAIACLMLASHGREAVASGLRQSIAAGMRSQWVVTVGLLPLTLLLFAQTSLVSPLANALAIPLVSFVVTPLALLGSVLPAPLHGWLLQAAHECIVWLAVVLQWLSSLPLAVWQVPAPGLLPSVLALAGTLWLLAPRGWPFRWAGALAWLPLLAAGPSAPSEGVWLTAFDVGQGNALLVETRNFRLLYDTGPAYSPEADGGSRVILPYLRSRGIARLDALVISHSDTDHAGGARSLLGSVPVGWIASSLPPGHALLGAGFGARHVGCVAGQRWQLDGVEFEFLHPLAGDSTASKPNARSCVLAIRFGQRAVLLGGDIEAPQERALLARAAERLRADVLLAPHHGSGTSSTPGFLDAVRPSVALFQVGYRNRYRHPKAEVVARYDARGIRVVRSDQAGAVSLAIDSAGIRLRRQCESPRYWSSRRCDDPGMSFVHDRLP